MARATNGSKTNQGLRLSEVVECDGDLYGQTTWESCETAAKTILHRSPTLRRMTFGYRGRQSPRVKSDLLLPRRFLSSELDSVIAIQMEPH